MSEINLEELEKLGKSYVEDNLEYRYYNFDRFKSLSPEQRDEAAKIVTEKISEKINYVESRRNDEAIMDTLKKALLFYNEVGESEKKYMRAFLLRWRTSGDNSERRHKETLFKNALSDLSKYGDKIKKDETIKSVSSLSLRKDSLLNKLNAQNIELSFDLDKDAKSRKKAERETYKHKAMQEEFERHGVNKPFTSDNTLIRGCPEWWTILETDGHGGEHREAIKPLYMFKSKDVVELVGAEVYEYDRMYYAGAGMSGPLQKVREISVEEYKKLVHEREMKRQE